LLVPCEIIARLHNSIEAGCCRSVATLRDHPQGFALPGRYLERLTIESNRKVSAADKGLAGPVLVELMSVRILNHAAIHNQDVKVVVSTYVVEYSWRPVALL
jgi:hypothetical protein